jgi:Ni/Co efflux regulator RcnB
MDCMIRFILVAGLSLSAAPAFAQLEPLPRFEALEQQLQTLEQQKVDDLGAARDRDRTRTALPNAGVSEAERGLRELDYNRERNALLLQAEQDRRLVQRERDLADAALPNTRVPRSSTAVVTSPEAYLLSPAPPGKYYARVQGRFVLVDGTSELVESVLPVQPTDPTADVPLGARPLPDFSLPARRVSPTSALVIRDPGALALPVAPAGQFYARVAGRIILVDARTEMPLSVVRPG